ncbi:MAG: hypothetical protein V4636_05395 [Pseudomonadota bacterium]
MARHEAGCTNNPNRVCKMHLFATGDEQAPNTGELLAAQAEGGYKRVCEITGNCPACKLAAFRMAVMPAWDIEIGIPEDWVAFSFKAEKDAVWAEHNSSIDEYHDR